jgi:hypothetical protein
LAEKTKDRKVFTTGIVSTREGQKIALFFTGKKHAGENLADLLTRRDSELDPPIQMCDALSRNFSEEFKAILANCIAHGRRKFIKVAGSFPDECRFVLKSLGRVYKYGAEAREKKMSPAERLHFHQEKSKPVMDKLEKWLAAQFEEKRVEPNSSLGKAIKYMTNHWEALTLFLREAGAPLDNNVCEQALKMAIINRKNALYYRTERGAWVGDLFMSIIHTSRLSGVNPFDYLTELQKHPEDLQANPSAWMPWNYKDAVKEKGD